jgi:hypothetical protein
MKLEDLLLAVGRDREAIDNASRVLDELLARRELAAVNQVASSIACQISRSEADACIYKGALTVSSGRRANRLIRKRFSVS